MYTSATRVFILQREQDHFLIDSEQTADGQHAVHWTGCPWFHFFDASLNCAEIQRLETRLLDNWVVRTYLPISPDIWDATFAPSTAAPYQIEVIFTRLPEVPGQPLRIAMAVRQSQHYELDPLDFGQIWTRSNVPQWIYDAETLKFIAANNAAVQAYGYSRDEFLLMTLPDICLSEDVEHPVSPLAALDGIDPQDLQTRTSRHRTRDGAAIEVEIATHHLSYRGRPAVLQEVRNVTQEIRVREHLEEAVCRYYQMLENINEGFFALNRNWHFLYVNHEAERLLGCSREDLLGISLQEALPQIANSRFVHEIERVMSEGESAIFEDYFAPRDAWYQVHAYPAKNGTSIFFQDITSRRKTEARLRIQIERMTALRTIDTAIVSSLDMRLTLNLIIELVLKHLKVDAACILQLNPEEKTLTYLTGCGFWTELLEETYLQLGDGYAGKAALEREMVAVEDLAADLGDRYLTHRLAPENFTSYYGIPLISKGEVRGVLELFRREKQPVDKDWLNFLEMLAGQTAIAIDNAALFTDLQRLNDNLLRAYDTTLQGWARALDLRDKETEGHSRRVTDYSVDLARRMNLPAEEIINIRRGAWLHDIGKMGVPDCILLKPDQLPEDEWQIMQRHPQFAYDLLHPIEFLRPALDIPYCHHEKWDGTGYPRGLRGSEIPRAARIFAVIDVFDALTSDRPYRPAWSYQKTLEYIREHSGTHFDPEVVEAFNEWCRAKFQLKTGGEAGLEGN